MLVIRKYFLREAHPGRTDIIFYKLGIGNMAIILKQLLSCRDGGI
jgi:hypothetical protein